MRKYDHKTVNIEGYGPMSVGSAGYDVNGNQRLIVHYSELGLDDNVSSNATRKAGLKKYRANWAGGNFVFQCYDSDTLIEQFIQRARKLIAEENKQV